MLCVRGLSMLHAKSWARSTSISPG